MWIEHHDLRVELPDDWLAAAGLSGFRPPTPAYRPDTRCCPGERVCLIAIADIGPVRRDPGVAIFHQGGEHGKTAHERAASILTAFRSGAALPPVRLVRGRDGFGYPYKLVDGTHRLYCSLAAGFTYIPAVKGFDMTALYDDPDPRDLC